MRKLALLGSLFFLLTIFMESATADDVFRYNYVQGAYQSISVDMSGSADKLKVSAPAVTGSYALNDMIALQGSVGVVSASFNTPGYTVDASGTIIGLGASLHKNVADNVEIGLDLGRSVLDYSKYTVNGTDKPSFKSYTSNATANVRAAVTPKLLLGASVGHNISDSNTGSGPGYSVNAEYYVAENLGVGGAYSISHGSGGYTRGITIGARYYF